MQSDRTVPRDLEVVHIIFDQRLIESFQLLVKRRIGAERDPLALTIERHAGQTLRVLDIHALAPVTGGHLWPGGHLREATDNLIHEASGFRVRETSHQGRYGAKSGEWHSKLHVLR